MKSNYPSEEPSGPVPAFNDLVEQSVAEGVIGGIVAFMSHHRVDLKPTKVSPTPLNDFTAKLLQEYLPGDQPFCFPESFKAHVNDRTGLDIGNLKALYDNGELDYLRGYGHVIGGAAVASFLEKYRNEALDLIRSIRGA